MRCIVLSLTALIFASAPVAAQDAGAAGSETATIIVKLQDFSRELERSGTFVPALFEEVSLWPEEYAGEFLILEALPHGAPVNEGDVVLRFDARGIDRQILQAERAVRSAELHLQNSADRGAIDSDASEAALQEAQAELKQARRALEGWEKFEIPFAQRDAEIRLQYTRHGIEDQEDELAQLEAMYRDDELTDATEEIVLKRARRNLARSAASLKLLQDRTLYDETYSRQSHWDRMKRSVIAKERALDRIGRTREIDERTRRDGLARAEEALHDAREKHERLRRDRDLLTVRASRGGLLLHGSPEDYRPGRVAPRHKRGGRAAARTTLFTISEPDRLGLALDIPESDVGSLSSGMAARIEPVLSPSVSLTGTLRLDRFPSPGSASAGENAYDAGIELESSSPGIAAGMRAKVKIVLVELTGVVILPAAAVFGTGDDAHCWAAGDGGGESRRVPLRLGPSRAGEIVVYGELSEGQKVLLCAPQK